MLKALWYTNPLWLIGAVLVVQLGILPRDDSWSLLAPPLAAAAFVAVMAYLQNWSYTLSSRASMRNSNAYHLLAAVVGSLTFFVTFRYLALNEMPGTLFLTYLFATVLGSIHGQTISAYIEKRLNLDVIASEIEKKLGIEKVEKKKEDPDDQFFRFWPSVITLLVAFVAEVAWLQRLDLWTILTVAAACVFVGQGLNIVQKVVMDHEVPSLAHVRQLLPATVVLGALGWVLYQDQLQVFMLVAVLLLSIPDNFLHAVLRVARNTDHYWFHLVAVLTKLAAGFLQLAILFKLDFSWAVFIPMTTGGMLGSLTGATFAAEFAKRIEASFDAHVRDKKKVGWPRIQMAGLVGVGFVAQLLAYGLYQWRGVLTLVGLSFLQMMSFTLISRARNRKDKQYHAWASVLSNGSWYLTMDSLADGNLEPFQAAPYVVGNATGSLIGQGVALKMEKLTGAEMVEKSTKSAHAPAIA